jgi:phage-related minor tail protein
VDVQKPNTKKPKEEGFTELRKDTEEANRRLARQLEVFQERLLKKTENMMNRGSEVRHSGHATARHRSSSVWFGGLSTADMFLEQVLIRVAT